MLRSLFFWFGISVLIYYLLLSGSYLLLYFYSVFDARRRLREIGLGDFESLDFAFAPPVSIVVPAFNEVRTIIQSLQTFLRVKYRQFEVIVVNDGSEDDTLKILTDYFLLERADYPFRKELNHQAIKGLYRSPTAPNLLVVDKEKGGRADALNAGINMSQYPLVCILDADSLLGEPDLLKVVLPIVKNPDVVAVGGQVGVANGLRVRDGVISSIRVPRNRVALFQLCEYLRAFIAGRIGWSVMNTLPNVSGAFGLFQKRHIMAVGGFDPNSIGEDMDMTLRLHKYFRQAKKKYKIAFVPDAISWTQVPGQLKYLARQRNRWHRGLFELMRQHKSTLFNPKLGLFGMVTLPYYLIFELLAPVIELLGYVVMPVAYLLGLLKLDLFLLVVLVALSFDVLFSLLAIVLERFTLHNYPRPGDFFRLLLYAFLENFGYRQLTVVWRVKGLVDYLRGVKAWGEIKRQGFTSYTPAK